MAVFSKLFPAGDKTISPVMKEYNTNQIREFIKLDVDKFFEGDWVPDTDSMEALGDLADELGRRADLLETLIDTGDVLNFLRESGYAVVALSPDELNGADPRQVEGRLIAAIGE